MAEIISEEQPRIKFQTQYEGHPPSLPNYQISALDHLSQLQSKLEDLGVIPILNDGLVGGNCALRFSGASQSPPGSENWITAPGSMFVSKSGKVPGAALAQSDFVLLTSFNRDTWSVNYRSTDADTRPSSDSPLHAAALSEDCCQRYNWSEAPLVAVHGHALAEGVQLEAAARAGMPISPEETLFSTPEDLEALERLFLAHPYPKYKCFVRRGHGFFLLAKSVKEAEEIFYEQVVPLLIRR